MVAAQQTASAVLALLLALPALVEARDNGVGRLPALGWNTWCTGGACGQPGYVHNASRPALHDVCNEAEVKQVCTETGPAP